MDIMDDTSERGELIARLRHGLRKCRQLAEQLSADPAIAAEARRLLGRLESVRGELDALDRAYPALREAETGPFRR